MASTFVNFVHSIFDWATAADHRYREACKMMELDDNVLDDIGITREELLAELGITGRHTTRSRLSRRESSYWGGLVNRRLARGRI